MRWIGPLFTNAGGWSAYVAYQDGAWFVDKGNPTKIGEGKSGVMLLPLMQEGYGESYSHQIELLKKGLTANDLSPELVPLPQ